MGAQSVALAMELAGPVVQPAQWQTALVREQNHLGQRLKAGKVVEVGVQVKRKAGYADVNQQPSSPKHGTT